VKLIFNGASKSIFWLFYGPESISSIWRLPVEDWAITLAAVSEA
jgi:hypothetical protein